MYFKCKKKIQLGLKKDWCSYTKNHMIRIEYPMSKIVGIINVTPLFLKIGGPFLNIDFRINVFSPGDKRAWRADIDFRYIFFNYLYEFYILLPSFLPS